MMTEPVTISQTDLRKLLSAASPDVVFGNEVFGVEQDVVNMCDAALEVPQAGTKHSLNIAVCAGVVIWDMFSKIVYRNK